MVDYPIMCPECGTEYNTRDELKENSVDDIAKTFHCPECTLEDPLFKLTIKKGRILDTQEFY